MFIKGNSEVLILVLVDDVLGDTDGTTNYRFTMCLNPCFGG